MKLFEPKRLFAEGEKDPILESDESLGAIAAMMDNSRFALEALVKERIVILARKIVFEIQAVELPLYRQALVELADLIDAGDGYNEEYKRRKAEKDKPPAPTLTDTSASSTDDAQAPGAQKIL